MGDVLLDAALEQQKGRNTNQKNPNCRGNEGVDARAVDGSKVAEQTYPKNRSGNAARGQRQNDFLAYSPLIEMNPARTNLGNEVEKGIRSHRDDRRYSENKN